MVSAQDKKAFGKPTDTVVVYTNIAPDESESFTKRFGGDADEPLDVSDPVDGTADLGNSAYDSFVDQTAFSTSAGEAIHGDRDKSEEEIVIPGTFAGAQGQYVCTEATGANDDCTSHGTNKGVRLIGDWTFDADAGAMAIKSDTAYSNFGWWLRVEDDGTYRADVFHNGAGIIDTENRPNAKTEFDALTGSATYEGSAAGKFAINSQLPGQALEGGHFTAAATLTANFETTQPKGGGPDGAGSIGGSIHDFVAADNPVDWTVTLLTAPITIDADNADFSGLGPNNTLSNQPTGAVWAIGGVDSSGLRGTWRGDFHDQGKDSNLPATVTGEFGVTYGASVGHMVGAFGASLPTTE